MCKRLLVFLFVFEALFVFCPSIFGQSEISNLTFEGCFKGDSREKRVSELTVSFEIKDASEIQFIYLHYADRNSADNKAKFVLIDFENGPDAEKKQGFDKVCIREKYFASGKVKDINFIRIYISDKNGNYSNELFFGE